MRFRLPMEASATVLAASTIFMGISNLPTWGIFLGWAATSLFGGPSAAAFKALWRTLLVGAVFAVVTLWLQTWLGGFFGPHVPTWLPGLVAILVMNPGMLLLGRFRSLSLIPGMFIGFSTVLAVYLGHFGPVPGNIISAGVCGFGMNLLGLGFAWAAVAMSRARAGSTTEVPAVDSVLDSVAGPPAEPQRQPPIPQGAGRLHGTEGSNAAVQLAR